jgi:LysR family glycine cleavage system transcriptional activator
VLSSFLPKGLTPRLANLRTHHPEVELRIHSSPELVDFARSDFHAAIRLGPGRYPGLHVEELMGDWLVVLATPRVLKKYGPVTEQRDLGGLPLLHGSEPDWSSWSAGGAQSRKAQRGAYMDDSAGILAAVTEGLGFAIIRWTLASKDVEAGRISLASERFIPYRFGYFLRLPKGLYRITEAVHRPRLDHGTRPPIRSSTGPREDVAIAASSLVVVAIKAHYLR